MRNLLKTSVLVSLFLFMSSCYQPKTHGKFITEKQDVWINGYAIRINEHEQADKGLVFCRAEIQEDGSARPKCFKAEFSE